MAAVCRIEGREANQTMHSALRAEIAKYPVPTHSQQGALNARFFAQAAFEYFDLIAHRLSPAQIHSLQHRCPIHRVDAPSPCMNTKNGILAIIFSGQHRDEFELANDIRKRTDFWLELLDQGFIVKASQFKGFVDAPRSPLPLLNVLS